MDKKNAFTLIELLVVIAIIAMLLSILMPSLSKAKEMAKKNVCRSNCRQWAISLINYATDNDDLAPGRYPSDRGTVRSLDNPYQYARKESVGSSVILYDMVSSFITPYVGEQKYSWCPDMKWENYKIPWDVQWTSWGVKGGDYCFFSAYTPEHIKLYGPDGTGHILPKKFASGKLAHISGSQAVVGDHVRYFGSISAYARDTWMYAHPWKMEVAQEPQGMNASCVDGSSVWVDYEDMEPFLQFTGGAGDKFYWPKMK